jgi:hypothetical protein
MALSERPAEATFKTRGQNVVLNGRKSGYDLHAN